MTRSIYFPTQKRSNFCAFMNCLVENRAINDPDEQLREWAQKQLQIHIAKNTTEEE
ncbi:hypothetical protein [Egbenema bharatensis]|uniref:hypothetical protein n=1 Tax=Egbenema bharatensis TaxID=3463334 RepID=UPI003A85DEA4